MESRGENLYFLFSFIGKRWPSWWLY